MSPPSKKRPRKMPGEVRAIIAQLARQATEASRDEPPVKRASRKPGERRARSPRPKVPDEKLAPAKKRQGAPPGAIKPALTRPGRDVSLVLEGRPRWETSFSTAGETPPQMELRLTEVRARLGLTQHDLGELVGAHAVTVCRWEAGTVAPGLWHLAILRALARAALWPPRFDQRGAWRQAWGRVGELAGLLARGCDWELAPLQRGARKS